MLKQVFFTDLLPAVIASSLILIFYAYPLSSYILKFCFNIFPLITALHGMQTRSSDENSVCPSVCPSVRLYVCHTREL